MSDDVKPTTELTTLPAGFSETERGNVCLIDPGSGGVSAWFRVDGPTWLAIHWRPDNYPGLTTEAVTASDADLWAHIRGRYEAWTVRKLNLEAPGVDEALKARAVPEALDPEALTGAALAALPFDPGWDDGRTGFEWARFDAVVDRARYLRAEVTWDDDSEGRDPATIKSNDDMVFTAPTLLLETNVPDPLDEGHWETLDTAAIHLTQALAAEIVAAPPADLLRRYPEEIAKLKFHEAPS